MIRLILLFSLLSIAAQAQDKKIELSRSLKNERVGYWKSGKFKICVPLDSLEKTLHAYFDSEHQNSKDSAMRITYLRYKTLADKMKNSTTDIDLSKEPLYDGFHDSTQEKGHSKILHDILGSHVIKNHFILYKRKTRIYSVNCVIHFKGGFGGREFIYYHRNKRAVFWRSNYSGF